MPVLRSWFGCGLLLIFVSAALAEEEGVSFSRDVKPILSQNCFACHGPDENKREAELRLDVRESAVAQAIDPGHPETSDLIARLISDDPDERMPPARSKKPALAPEQIAILKQWIAQGAPYDAHWSYAPLAQAAIPTVQDQAWAKRPVDAFVLAKLEAQGLTPGAAADRRTLLRRLSFDLTGLPPSAADTAAFENDASPDSYERAIDRLLGSQHFGERMAMYWLDLVRYADTNGIHGDNHRDHALYRDYVIDAFNHNKPFDQFTIEQLAGDLLPDATREQQIASGYNRLNMTTREGGAQAKEYLAKYAADRVRNASTVWLGSTLGCAECHNHKFDPFLTRDFYSFAAFFSDVQETAVGTQQPSKLPTAEQTAEQARRLASIAVLKKQLQTSTPELEAAQAAWEAKIQSDLQEKKVVWQATAPTAMQSTGGVKLALQEDGSLLTSGPNPATAEYTITLENKNGPTTGIRLEVLTDAAFPGGGLSRANGNFVLTDFTVNAMMGGQLKPIAIRSAAADFEQGGFPIAHAIDQDAKSGWAVEGHVKKENRTAVFVLEQPVDAPALILKLSHNSVYAGHNIGRFRLALTDTDAPTLSNESGPPAEILQLLRTPEAERSKANHEKLAAYYRGISPLLNEVRKTLAEQEKDLKTLQDSFPAVLITKAGPPRKMRVLPRGNWLDDSGEVVEPAVPSFLKQLEMKDRATRLDLANWLVERENPLVARVFVNRLWKLMFGEGLVRSLDDFGSQGAPPSHPALLDFLAVEFIESGWDVKQMIKRIAMSNTYQLSSFETPQLRELDPTNRLLARQNRFRLDAEMVRDNALAISGLLTDKIGGPSVKPYQPAGYWAHLNFPKRQWQHDDGANQYRRGLYTYWCRTFLHPSLLAFDAPSREESCVLRSRSNTPQQALVLLNDPTYVEAARVFAERIVLQGGTSPTDRIGFAMEQALGRPPRPQELTVLAKLAAQHQEQYAADPAAAKALLEVGMRSPSPEIDAVELAAWTSIARVILNLHETITRY